MGVWGWKAVGRNPGLLRSAQFSPGQPLHQRTAEGTLKNMNKRTSRDFMRIRVIFEAKQQRSRPSPLFGPSNAPPKRDFTTAQSFLTVH